jgi:type II secretory pathway pseudopilin PulG
MKAEDRDGFVLAAVLLAMILIAALVGGVLFAATEETRIGAALTRRQLTLSAAESAIEATIADWPNSSVAPVGIGETQSTGFEDLGVAVTVYVTRLDSTIYWIVADAGDAAFQSGVARRVGTLVTVQNAMDGSIAIDRIPERWWSELF